MYKILFTDLDATLLNNDNTLSEKNYKAIHKAVELGFPVVISSGRSNMSLDQIISRYDLPKTYTIGYNGGIIYKGDKVIAHELLEVEMAKQILKSVETYDCQPLLYQMDKLWVKEITPDVQHYCNRSYIDANVVDSLYDCVEKDVSKIVVFGENSTLKAMKENLSHLESMVSISFSSKTLLEFNPLGINKGTALVRLANYLNIPVSQTIGMGDNYNDIEMIEMSGLGVAVKNSNADIKQRADYITENDNNNSAVAEVIEKFILEE